MTTGDMTLTLTNSVLESNNIDFVLNYLYQSIGKDIIISDYKGKIIANIGQRGEDLESEYFDLILNWQDLPYLYVGNTKTFCYKVGPHKQDGFIFVKDMDSDKYGEIIIYLEQASLPLRIYFNKIACIENLENNYTHDFLTDILLRSINIKEIIKQNYSLLHYDLNALYYVSLFCPKKDLSELEKQALLAYSKDWLKRHNLDIHCTYWESKYLVFICPTHYDNKTLDIDFSWEKHKRNNSLYYDDVRRRFKFEAGMSMGDKYVLDQLHRSYQEALYTLYLSDLIGNGNRVNHICNLGIFTPIFKKNNIEELKTFCYKLLKPLIINDRENNSMFMETLRNYFDTNLNTNETAERLYLHINTLRYRLKRIEELTNTSLQKMDDRCNLYIALKVHDVLEHLALIE